MDLNTLQKKIMERHAGMGMHWNNPAEIVLSITEELGEVAKEVALFEKIGNKVNWKRSPDKDLLSEEMTDLLITAISLATHYDINISELMENRLKR